MDELSFIMHQATASENEVAPATVTPNQVSHTPGPWVATKVVLNFGRVITKAEHARRPYGASVDADQCRDTYMAGIAHVGQHACHFSRAEADANARLIAAAPELLAIATEVLSMCVPGEDLHDRVSAVIAKATGHD